MRHLSLTHCLNSTGRLYPRRLSLLRRLYLSRLSMGRHLRLGLLNLIGVRRILPGPKQRLSPRLYLRPNPGA